MADGRDYFKATIDTTEFDKQAQRIKDSFRDIGRNAELEGSKIEASFKNIGVAIAGIFTVKKATEFTQSIVQVRGEFQQLGIAFETMIGKAKSDALMAQMIDTAAKTPFDLTGVANGAKQLLAYGTASEEVNDTLIRLGNIASGLSIPLNDLVYLYGTTQTQGRLFTQDVRQFMGRGIPLVKELAKNLGKTEEQINSMVTAGQIGFPEVQKVIENMTNQGGMFYNLMEKQSASWTGQIENFKDAWDVMLNEFGSKSDTVFNSAIGLATSLVENYEKVGKALAGLVAMYGTYKAACAINALAVKGWTAAEVVHFKWMQICEAKQKLLNSTMLSNPYILATVAVVGLVAAIWTLHDSTTAQSRAQALLNKLNDEAKQKKEDLEGKTSQLVRVLNDETKSMYSKITAYKELQALLPKELANMEMSTFLAKSATDQQILLNKAYEDFGDSDFNATLEKYKKLQEKLKEAGTNKFKLKDVYSDIAESFDIGFFKKILMDADALPETLNKEVALLERQKEQRDANKREADLLALTDEKRKNLLQGQLRELEKQKDALNDNIKITGLSTELYGTQEKAINDSTKSAESFNYVLGKGDKILNPWIAKEGSLKNMFAVATPEIFSWITSLNTVQTQIAKIKGQLAPSNLIVEKNKESLEKIVKDNTDKINAMNQSAVKAIRFGSKEDKAKIDPSIIQEYKTYRKEIDEANKDLKVYDFSDKGGKDAENLAEKARRERQAQIDDQLRYENDLKKAALDKRNSFLENQQKELDLEDDSFTTKQKQINLNHQKELLNIEKNAQELIEKRQDAEYKQWKLNNPKGSKTPFVSKMKDTQDLPLEDQQSLTESVSIANRTRLKANEDLLKSLLEKYQDNTAKRKALEKQFNDDVSAFEKQRTNRNSTAVDRAIAEAKKQYSESLSSFNLDELRDSIDWQNVFGDLNRVSAEALENLRDKLKIYLKEVGGSLSATDLKTLTEALEQLNQKYAQLKPNKVFTEGLKEFKDATENIKRLKKELKEIQNGKIKIHFEYDKKTDKMIPVVETAKEAEEKLTIAQLNRIKALNKIDDSLQGVSEKMHDYVDLGREVASTFEDFGGKIPEGVQMTLDGLGKINDGMSDLAEGAKNGNVIQMISGGVKALGGMAKTVKGLFGGNVNKEHRQALRYLEEQKKQLEQIVALERLREDLQYKGGDTIFGSDKWGKARNGAVNYAESVKQLQKSFRELEDVDVVTGSKKKGWGPFKKRKDVWSDLLDAYPKLIDANGKFDQTLAQTILTTQNLSDQGKQTIQNAIDNAAQVEDAYAVMKDQLTDIFGDLGNSITNTFVDAFKNGTDAAKLATEKIGELLEKLTTEMIYSVTLAPIKEEYSQKMMDISSNTNMTDEKKYDAYIDLISSMSDEALAQQETVNKLLGYAEEKAKQKGIDLFKSDERQATAKGVATASQDSINETNGRLTTMQSHTFSINENVIKLRELSQGISASMNSLKANTASILTHVQHIDTNTGEMRGDMSAMRSDINTIVNHGLILKK